MEAEETYRACRDSVSEIQAKIDELAQNPHFSVPAHTVGYLFLCDHLANLAMTVAELQQRLETLKQKSE